MKGRYIMELVSQKMRELAPELVRFVLEPAGNRKIYQNRRYLLRVLLETVIREAVIWTFWWKKSVRVRRKQADMGQDITAPISVTARARELTVLTTALQAVK